jgi:hypothetical protein
MCFFSDVNPYRTPGDTAPASHTSRHTKLIYPICKFMSQPLTITGLGGGSDTSAGYIGMIDRKARIPFPASICDQAVKVRSYPLYLCKNRWDKPVCNCRSQDIFPLSCPSAGFSKLRIKISLRLSVSSERPILPAASI